MSTRLLLLDHHRPTHSPMGLQLSFLQQKLGRLNDCERLHVTGKNSQSNTAE